MVAVVGAGAPAPASVPAPSVPIGQMARPEGRKGPRMDLAQERMTLRDLSPFAMRFTSKGDLLRSSQRATDWCPRETCGDCGFEDRLFRPLRICGVTLQSAAWITNVVFVAGWLSAVVVDLTEGYPGAGLWLLAYMAPAATVPASITDLGMVVGLYLVLSALYLMWGIAFGLMRGMEDELLTADGANIVNIGAALLIETTPYFTVAYIFIVSRFYTGLVVRNRVEQCMHAVAQIEADHETAMRAARVQMPPFALRLLHGDTTGVELEDTTAVLVLRIHVKIRHRDMKSRDKSGNTDKVGAAADAPLSVKSSRGRPHGEPRARARGKARGRRHRKAASRGGR